ncbi:4Fe-4S dicluster domain-containing protein [Dethiosulfatarculus sandiegensis]|uniref:4Fe-4S ferredoxin-type domain-containing protein n=1 Tax=Dethiosulfatarculus sandiegensis TaxID=1429043 RepID=A0A0D2JSS6_9BACT|nr:4Fe-4S dicluster domain-containing protein [Dethiosulfatarculus sandiegensis]KIX12500.1 hypothetical protein X474_18750 [Dethiosulfatarculus sandiegensis]
MIEQKKYTECCPSAGMNRRDWLPVIDLGHCKACGACVEACLQGVLQLRRIDSADFERLGWLTRKKIQRHDMLIAFVVHESDCQCCGRCLAACRKRAIKKHPATCAHIRFSPLIKGD